MGHPLAPYVLQRLSTAVATRLNHQFHLSMITYLDDWLIFGPRLPARRILSSLQQMGFTINLRKSIIQPTSRLIYLGLQIDARHGLLRPTPQCLQHMRDLLSVVPQASPQDLRRIAGYVTWLAWAMNWPTFIATHLLQRETYWIHWCLSRGLLDRPRPIAPQLRSLLVYTDATPTSIGVYLDTRPPQQVFQPFQDAQPIAVAEMAAALFALIWIGQRCYRPMALSLDTDSAVVYYTLSTGKGITFRRSPLLQRLYVTWFRIKMDRGHGLVLRWVPSNANLADAVSRGVLAQNTARWLDAGSVGEADSSIATHI
jgi:hypothetical protein